MKFIKHGNILKAIKKGAKFFAFDIGRIIKNLTVGGIPPITFENSIGKPLVNYKIYGNSKQAILPDDYQQVEYVETTGANYFDTGVPLKSGLKMVVDWVYKDSSSGNSYTGGHIGSPGNRWLVGSQRKDYYYFAVGASNVETEFAYGNRDIIEAYWADKASYLKVNGVLSTKNSYVSYTLAEEPDYTFYLGAVNRNGTGSSIPKLTIYGGQFYQDDVFLRDYIPCVRISDSTPGLYDLVNKSFITVSGSGDLLDGNNVPNPDTPIEVSSVDKTIPVSINGNITTINLNEPLRKVGEYADFIDYENKKIVRKVASVELNGSENWGVYKSNSASTVFNLDDTLTPLIGAPISATYMSHFQLTDIAGTVSFPAGVYRFGYSSTTLNITTTRLYASTEHTTLDEFKAWLAENKPVILYPLATPIEEDIELPEVNTELGNNTLTIDTEVEPSYVEITYAAE